MVLRDRGRWLACTCLYMLPVFIPQGNEMVKEDLATYDQVRISDWSLGIMGEMAIH